MEIHHRNGRPWFSGSGAIKTRGNYRTFWRIAVTHSPRSGYTFRNALDKVPAMAILARWFCRVKATDLLIVTRDFSQLERI
ncbi:hypothetical protein [Roseimaritima ulvae]|uniref:hypothetical protein n=1 Tax=Roseimaritima ulvae TaxID=980254 RepID=UPI0011CDB21F|nr:hypothetical protein [Roseimaritima ulvae]